MPLSFSATIAGASSLLRTPMSALNAGRHVGNSKSSSFPSRLRCLTPAQIAASFPNNMVRCQHYPPTNTSD